MSQVILSMEEWEQMQREKSELQGRVLSGQRENAELRRSEEVLRVLIVSAGGSIVLTKADREAARGHLWASECEVKTLDDQSKGAQRVFLLSKRGNYHDKTHDGFKIVPPADEVKKK